MDFGYVDHQLNGIAPEVVLRLHGVDDRLVQVDFVAAADRGMGIGRIDAPHFESGEAKRFVVRIFEEYAAGHSPKRIAAILNRDNVPNTSGQGWSQSTLNGNPKRGTGVLNNELYVGRRVWNKTRKVKDPDTGVRLSRANPQSEWIINEVPELRIVDQELWDRAKARQKVMTHSSTDQLWTKRRPVNLLSFMLRCGECGGGFAKSNATGYSCATAQNKGTCSNRLRIRQDVLEEAVLESLRAHLMDAELCAEFCREYTEHVNRLRSERNSTINLWQAERDRLQKRRDQIVKAIGDGFANDELKVEFNALIERRNELDRLLNETPKAPVMLHPAMAEKYRTEVAALTAMLRQQERSTEAAEILRSLIDKIVLTPNDSRTALVVDLYGDLAGIINLAISADKGGSKSGLKSTFCPATTEALNHFNISELSAVAPAFRRGAAYSDDVGIVGSPSWIRIDIVIPLI